jgi:hypothetical protein
MSDPHSQFIRANLPTLKPELQGSGFLILLSSDRSSLLIQQLFHFVHHAFIFIIWSHKISEYDGVDGAISRVSPAVDGNQVIIGDILSSKSGAQRRERDGSRRQTGFLWIAVSGRESYDGSCLSN